MFQEYNPMMVVTGYGTGMLSGRKVSLNYQGLASSSTVDLAVLPDGRTMTGMVNDPIGGRRPITLVRQ